MVLRHDHYAATDTPRGLDNIDHPPTLSGTEVAQTATSPTTSHYAPQDHTTPLCSSPLPPTLNSSQIIFFSDRSSVFSQWYP